jgi:hypothetical protein
LQDCVHRLQSCDDSAARRESQAGWNFRKGQRQHALPACMISGPRWKQCGDDCS